MVVADKLKIAFNYYLDHQDELVAQYAGKYVVIHDNGRIRGI